MQNDTTTQSALFPDLFRKPVVIQFDQPNASSDGGSILLGSLAESVGELRFGQRAKPMI